MSLTVSNATVKLVVNDSTTPLIDHFMLQLKEVWERFHTDNQKTISFNSRLTTVGRENISSHGVGIHVLFVISHS